PSPSLVSLLTRPPPISTPFPYTTLFRSRATTLFVIKAVNAVGKEYRTYTNSEGRYALFVPEDQYLLSITPHKTTDYIEIKEATRHIRTAKQPTEADFDVLIKSRTVETKKFNSVKF